MKRIGRVATLMLACVLQASVAVGAQESTLSGSSGGVAYASGGVGVEQRTAMAALRGDYNLRLMFATRGSGAMLAGISLRITDSNGRQMLALDDCGPQVYVRLPAGTYTIAAASAGTEQRRRTTLGKPGIGRDLYLYWHGVADED